MIEASYYGTSKFITREDIIDRLYMVLDQNVLFSSLAQALIVEAIQEGYYSKSENGGHPDAWFKTDVYGNVTWNIDVTNQYGTEYMSVQKFWDTYDCGHPTRYGYNN